MPKRLSLIDAGVRKRDEFIRGESPGVQPWREDPSPLARIEPERKKTTFNIDATLHHRLKLTAVNHRREMVDIVEEALMLHLRNLEAVPVE